MKLGEIIKNRRLYLKMTQSELASLLHITPQGLSNYENGKTKIPLSLVLDFCSYLKMDINSFFSMSEICEHEFDGINTYDFNNVYKNLAYHRENSKLTLKELSKKVGISIKRLSEFELNKTSPTIEEFITLCHFYNVKYDEMFLLQKSSDVSPKKRANKRKLSKKSLQILTISSILALLGISIVTPLIILNSNNPPQKIVYPQYRKATIKESINSTTSTTTLYKEQDYYLFLYMDNIQSFQITSFIVNNVFYGAESFYESSTNEQIIIELKTDTYGLGKQNISIDRFTYIDENKNDKEVSLKEEININVLTNIAPTIILENIELTSNSIHGNIKALNDRYSILRDKKINIILKINDKIINSLETSKHFEFNNLDADQKYQLEITITADFFDGKGTIKRILLIDTFETPSMMTLSNIDVQKSSASFDIILNNRTSLKLESLKIYDFITSKLIYETTNTSVIIENLFSNRKYRVEIKVLYKDKDFLKEKTYIEYFTTGIIDEPIVDFFIDRLEEQRVSFKANITFDLDNFKFNFLKLTSSIDKRPLIIEKENGIYTFEDLYSDCTYDAEYNYSYDLMDGNGKQRKSNKIQFKTNQYINPNMFFSKVSPTFTSIYIEVIESQTAIKPKYIKTELYKDDILLETTNLRKYKFNNLEENYNHTLKIYYSYDLQNGQGEIFKSSQYSIITNPDIPIIDLRPIE